MNKISAAEENIYASLGLTRPEEPKKRDEVGQETFLKLMVTQLKNQDPFKPMENGEFLSQIAQFSTVTGINELNDTFSQLAASLSSNQALQAGALVDRQVLAPLEYGVLPLGGGMQGAVDLPVSAGDVALRITDARGVLVRELRLGSQQEGLAAFRWDGVTERGEYAPPGVYRIQATADYGDETVALQTLTTARVDSVSIGSDGRGLTLNLEGLGPVSFNDVKQIH